MAAQPDEQPVPTAESHATKGGVKARSLIAPVVLVAGIAALIGGITYTVSTRPTIDVESLLRSAAATVERHEYEAAIEELNTKVLPVVNAGLGGEQDVIQFFVLRAQSVYEAAAAAGIMREENFTAVLSDYSAARERGATLSAADVVRVAMSQLELGKIDEAIKEARTLPAPPAAEADARRRIVKLAVVRSLRDPKVNFERTLDLLVELAGNPNITDEEAAWGLARQAELLMGVGRGEEAITKLLRDMQLLRSIPPASEAELSDLLGRAYADRGELAEAGRQFERVVTLAEPASELRGSALVQLGRIRQATGQLDQARELFASALESAADSAPYVAGLAGRASVLAAQGEDEAAMHDYAELIEKLSHIKESKFITSDEIAKTLMEQHADRYLVGRTNEALRYAVLAESLYADKKAPADVVLALASSNRRLADELMMRPAVDESAPKSRPVGAPAPVVDSVSREEAKRAYLAAGRYFAIHAGEVVVADAESASRSRWLAADSYDLAGDIEEATKAFAGYLQGASPEDPRGYEAKYRLARVFQSTGDFATAASLFLELINQRKSSPESGVLIWAARSMVPLAQCYLSDSESANDADAERELLSILSGRDFTPQAEEFRDALVELGRYYYESGQYPLAIERLHETETRFPADPEIERVRFRLADSQRLSAAAIERSLLEAMPQAKREGLEQTREQRLMQAMSIFERVQASLGAVPSSQLGPVERVLLRNSAFYLGDCAYDLADYDRAISYYDAARQQYDADPASLVALVQIVNSYVNQSQWAKAVTANERARQHLAKFPESVWADPDLPMDKRHWERWLDSRSLLEQHARTADAEPVNSKQP